MKTTTRRRFHVDVMARQYTTAPYTPSNAPAREDPELRRHRKVIWACPGEMGPVRRRRLACPTSASIPIPASEVMARRAGPLPRNATLRVRAVEVVVGGVGDLYHFTNEVARVGRSQA